MRKTIGRIFERYGTDAVIGSGENARAVKAFFQNVRSKSQQNMQATSHPLGFVPGGQYVCMLPVGTAVEAGDTLTVAEKEYVVCRVEDVPVCPEPVYRWALCTGKGSEEAWG